jgi:putative sugar O-methyltransferase
MVEFSFDKDFIKRYRSFLDSKEYKFILDSSKTEYWDYQSKIINIEIAGNKVRLCGSSGFTIPPSSKTTQRIFERIKRVVENPKKVIPFFKEKIRNYNDRIKLLNFYDAFDKVMNHDRIADPTLSPYRINFMKLKEKAGVFASVSEIRKDYFASVKYTVTEFIVLAYYWFNILNGFLDIRKVKRIVEIGAGSGNLMSILHHHINNCVIIDVDLPESISHSILFIKDVFPSAKILMPNEVSGKNFNDYDFVYLVPNQIALIENDSIDLAINTSTFQELKHNQTQIYYDLIQMVCAQGSHFLCSNRVEKIPSGANPYTKECLEKPNRFSAYPWNPNNDILCYEVCRLYRLVQLDSVCIRLETINKAGS